MNKKIILLSLLFFISCGEYQKVLKSDDPNYKYQMALSYYQDGDFNRAMPIFRELVSTLRATSNSENIIYYLAYCHYQNKDYITSSYLFKNYIQTFPFGKHIEESNYMSAYCMYLESPNYSLDATATKKAIIELNAFIDRYPNSSKLEDAENLILELEDKIALKSFENAKQYYTTENYKSAIIAFNNVLIDYPNNKYREEIQFLILRSTFELANNSISNLIEKRLNETIDAFMVFNDNYPESKFKKQAEKINNQAILSLKQFNK
tara:strand:- start:4215 stop:5006 length:792 start_codon:yes stop_codon:yes gene_type:complete